MDNCQECKSANIEQLPPENCSCHINPPCSSCTDAPLVCKDCGHQQEVEPYKPSQDYKPTEYKTPMERLAEMDGTKIDWVCIPHTHFTMKKVGRYPIGTDKKEVEKEVIGTFGGRFERFSNGHFEYIAYTD